MLSEIGNLDNQIDSFSDGITDCFSEFYKQEMKSAVKKGKLYDLDSETSSFKSLIKGRIIDLDDIIEDFIQQISKNNDLLNKLKGMLDQAVNVIQDVIPGGK